MATRNTALRADAQLASKSVTEEMELRRLRKAGLEAETKQLRIRWSDVLEDATDDEGDGSEVHMLAADAPSDASAEEPPRELDCIDPKLGDHRSEERPKILEKTHCISADESRLQALDLSHNQIIVRSNRHT